MKSFLSAVIFFVLIVFLIYMTRFEAADPKLSNSVLLAPPREIEHYSFGYKETYADLLWIRTIQNFEACGVGKNYAEEYDYTKPEDKDLTKRACHLGWVYQMIESVTNLAPKFYFAYKHGAIALSILVGDKEGARRIYEKAVAQFPLKWNLHYEAGYHYLFELKDPIKAAEHYNKAAELGAPKWVASFAAKLYKKEGQLLAAYTVLRDFLSKTSETDLFRPYLEKRLKQIQEEMKQSGMGHLISQ